MDKLIEKLPEYITAIASLITAIAFWKDKTKSDNPNSDK